MQERVLVPPGLAGVRETAYRLRVHEEVLIGHLQTLLVAPPIGLLLSSMPPQLLRQEPARRPDWLTAGQPREQVLDVLLPLLQLDRGPSWLPCRPGNDDPELGLRLRPAVFKPVAQHPG